jgi:hypothetical protein
MMALTGQLPPAWMLLVLLLVGVGVQLLLLLQVLLLVPGALPPPLERAQTHMPC